jgi:hypothetical protein
MNSKWVKVIFFCFKLSTACFSQSYCTLYPKECKFTSNFFDENKEKFEEAAKLTGLSPSFIFSIVAPEVSQFSFFYDKLETHSLKVMYVQGGHEYANFSIGFFQMKPSFIEKIEQAVQSDTLLKKRYRDCLFVKPQERNARVTRIERLSTLEWQIKYLVVFCEIIKQRFKHMVFVNNEERLQFYAAAYNTGFYKTEEQIKKTEKLALFTHFLQKKFKYSDISIFFYTQITK